MSSVRVLPLLVALGACRGASPKGDAAPLLSTSPAHRTPPSAASRAVTAPELCLSAGRIVPGPASQLHVGSGGMRAIIAGDTSPAAELELTYRGPSAETTPLASGELRRQIGLKLRAKDTCNVVYVMWHVEPTSGIAVSVKNNPGASTHAACGDRGYINLKPTASAPVPRLQPNETHVLRAEIDGEILRVLVDGAVAWTGALPPAAFTFDGPAGIRSDNGSFDFELRVPHPRTAGARCASR